MALITPVQSRPASAPSRSGQLLDFTIAADLTADPHARVTLQGGTFNIYGGGSTDTNITINTLTTLDGQNNDQLQPLINQGSTVVLNIGNLALGNNQTTIQFNGYVGTFPEGPVTPNRRHGIVF
jgi:hypothetical protein